MCIYAGVCVDRVGGAEIHFSVYFRGEEFYSACRHWEGMKESASFLSEP